MPIINKLATPGTTSTSAYPRGPLTVFFALDGFIFAGWIVRIPAIKEQTGTTASTLGLALLGVSAGAVITMMLTGRLCRRFGSLRVSIACAALMSLSVILPPLTRSALSLGLVLLLFGAAYGSMSVALNSAAVNVVNAIRRPVMPAFHAAYSLGGMLGAGLGGLVAGQLSPTRHLLGLAVIGLVVTAVAARPLLRHGIPDPVPAGPAAPADAPARKAAHRMEPRTRRLVLVFGVIALCTAYGEGALADWGALHLEETLAAHPGVAAAGYSCFALTMTIGRFSGTTLLERLGRTRTLVAGGATAAVGMLVAALAPTLWLALAGFAVTGLGLANIFPVAVERAGALAGPNGIAAASTLGYGGLLLAPPAIGFMADWYSLPTALTSVALLAAVASVIAWAIRDTRTTPVHG